MYAAAFRKSGQHHFLQASLHYSIYANSINKLETLLNNYIM